MTTDERNNVVSYLDAIDLAELPKKIAEAYPDQSIDQTRVGDYTLRELTAITNRLCKQLRYVVSDANYWPYLPETFQYSPRGRAFTLSGLVSSVNACISVSNFDELATHVPHLVSYQMMFGFWDRSAAKLHRAENIQLADKEQALSILTEQQKTNQQTIEKLLAELQTERESLEEYRAEKEQQFRLLSQNQVDSDALKQQINDSLATATGLVAKLESLHESQDKQSTLAEEKRTKDESAVEALTTEHQAVITEVEARIQEFDAKLVAYQASLQAAQSAEAHMAQKKVEIDHLAAVIADTGLGHTFKKRYDALRGNVLMWRWFILGATCLAIGWAAAITTDMFGHWKVTAPHNEWLMLLMNAVKMGPVVYVLIFTVQQYLKERKLEEEYAFREAVALTMTAYADSIGDADARKQFLMESAQRVYTPPQLFAEKSEVVTGDNVKQTADFLKSIAESVKNLQSK